MNGHSKLLRRILDWFRLLARWRNVVSIRSAWNLIRLIRSSWVMKGIPAGAKRPVGITILRPFRRKIQARLYTSDILVFEEVFERQIYTELVSGTVQARYIIDCGANVGYASIFFLQRFPGCHILAIEPEEGNVAMCRVNLAAEIQQGHVQVLQAAAWASDNELRVVDREAAEWGFRVASHLGSETCLPVHGYSLARLIKLSGFPYIDIFKVDIEGAELSIFRAGLPDVLLAGIRTLIVELHGPESAESFYSTLRGKPFSLRQFGNYAVAENNEFSERMPGRSAIPVGPMLGH